MALSEPEQEVKFRVSEAFVVPDLGGDGVRHVADGSRSLETTYWDTTDMRLARHGHTVRYRASEDASDNHWTLKLGGRGCSSLLQRREVDCEGEPVSPPDVIVDALVGITDGRPLVAVVTMRTDRQQSRVEDEHGRRLLTVDDDRVAVFERNRVVGSFREVEVELADEIDGKHAMKQAGRMLRHAAGEPDPTPKLVRAVGTIAQREPLVLGRNATVDELVRFTVRDGLDQLLLHDPAIRLNLGPEDVHQARIATRRLRANLRTLRPLLDRRTVDGMRDEVRWAGQMLGHVRDLDVLRASFAASFEDKPAPDSEALIAVVDAQRATAHARLVDAMQTARWQSMLRTLGEAAVLPPLGTEIPPTGRAREAVRPLVRKSWRRLERRVEAASASPAGWHEVRKAAKSLRYGAELLEPFLGADSTQLARNAERIQTQLGLDQDNVVARDWLQRHEGVAGPTARTLTTRYADNDATDPSHWKKLWKRSRRSAMACV